uniref:S-norcoclaurine synthase 1 n=1 Tax=Cajanus cajan TaxID=3821 RepID=A0A151R515_CAJCA|nr:S-norcoclaurine synthase 1 [Cajanus cajan]
MPHLSSEVPVIDSALLSNGNKEELFKLDVACKEWGFFQLVNHGVQKELVKKMKILMSLIEMEEASTFTPSIPLPNNVQEMVRNNPLHVPKRYVRSQEELEKSNYMPHLSSQIPVIDLALLSNGNKGELFKLDIACKEWGFFQVVNHGVQKELLHKMKEASSEFFKLPIEEKNKYAMAPNDIQGYGQVYVASEEQTLDWSDALMLITYPTQFKKLQFWPKTPEGFKEIIEAYASEVRRVGEELLSSLSVIIGMQKHDFLGLHKESLQGLRVNYLLGTMAIKERREK